VVLKRTAEDRKDWQKLKRAGAYTCFSEDYLKKIEEEEEEEEEKEEEDLSNATIFNDLELPLKRTYSKHAIL